MNIVVFEANALNTLCADGLDNDFDGFIDYPQDPQCVSIYDDSEGPTGRGLFLDLSNGRDTADAGDALIYTITLRTERLRPYTTDLTFALPHQTNLLSATDSGYATKEGFVRWDNVTVYPGRVRKLYVHIGVTPHAKEDLLLIAEVAADGEKATDTTRVEETVERIGRFTINVTDGKKFAQPGETLRYVIGVRNSTGVARPYTLRLGLPKDTTFVGGTPGAEVERRIVQWKSQRLPVGERAEYVVDVYVSPTIANLIALKMRASIDGVVATDITSVHSGVSPAGVTVEIADGVSEARVGDILTYNVVMRNTSNVLATHLDANVALPSTSEFVSASEGGFWTGKKVRWEGITIPPYGERLLKVSARVRNDAPQNGMLRATVHANGFEAVDITRIDGYTNNFVRNTQRALLSKNANRRELRPGDSVRYKLRVANTTNTPLRNVVVEDQLDPRFSRIRHARNARLQDSRLHWNVPELAPGEEWETEYIAKVPRTVSQGTRVRTIARIHGEGVDSIALADRTRTSNVQVIENLPPTGAPIDVMLAALFAATAAGLTFLQKRFA